MNSAARARLHDLTLKARRLLTEEVRALLEGVYGLSPDGSFEPEEQLPAVRELDEVRATRGRLEAFLADEAEAGLAGREAVDKLVGEVAFTHLNRLVAFKMLEARALMKGTLDKHHESNAFKRYVVEHEQDYERYLAGDLPKDRLGEGPRDVAYRHFLLDQCARMAEEVRVLFDPDDLASHLFPRPRALRDLVEMLNAPEVAEAWAPGSDETLGWVYQYFNEREKAEVFERLYKKKQKIRAEDVPAATQLFTPRWIVRQLVHNTLGRLWVGMHPDSRLKESLDYLVPLAGETPPPMKPAREISVLDPACGTMHFGLVAFDVLAEMYREELENAGSPGWPEEPSVADEAEIPAAIVRNNLFGMDIDLRAVQLSALTLFLKAKSLNPQAAITDNNLACADVRLPDGDRLDAIVREAGFDRPVYERLVRAAWKRLANTAVAGSLVRVEEEIRDLIRRERDRYLREGLEPDFFGESSAAGFEDVADEQFWTLLEGRILEALHAFARRQAEAGNDESYFVGEATKGLRVLDVMLRRYDVVVANPPYMAKGNVNRRLATFLDGAYSRSKRDLYTAFIERCAEFLNENGRLGMIAQQSFMFVSSYEKMRTRLLEDHAIETVCHVGSRAFAEISGEKVNTVMFVLRREGENRQGDRVVGTYLRLVREPNAKAKRLGFERALVRLRSGKVDPNVFHYRQGDLRVIPGMPWVYWITPGLRQLFEVLPNLKDASPPKQGMATADNFRFLRFWWEVGTSEIGFGIFSLGSAQAAGKKWFPYTKGGSFQKWWGNQEFAVNWTADGAEMKEHVCAAYPYLDGKWEWVVKNADYYFRRGVTWTDLTSGRLSTRLLPGGFVFDRAGSSVFPKNIPLILAMMNSALAQYLLKLLNPTLHVQVGDLARLPIPKESSGTLQHLVDEAVGLAKADSAEDQTTYDFVAPPDWKTGPDDVRRRKDLLAKVEAEIDEEVYRLYGISDEDRAAIESELADPVVAEGEESTAGGEEAVENAGLVERRELALRWISYAVGNALGRFSPGEEDVLGRGRFSPEVAASLRDLVDPDGVATLQADHSDDLATKVERALELMVGEDETGRLLEAAGVAPGADGLRRYLKGDFFKRHVRLYRKRPVYWLLQSPRKSYGLYLFHERITPDTLYLLGGNRYLGGEINRLRDEISDLSGRASAAPQGAEKKRLAKEMEAAEERLLDLEAFARNLSDVTSQTNTRGEVAGWRPELDDGVILNLAPLHALMPSWSAEPRKTWAALEAGSYDWSRAAMRYWPDRVLEECRKNKSYAIAHGRLDEYVGGG